MSVGRIGKVELEKRLSSELPGWQVGGNFIERIYPTTGWKSTLMIANVVGYLAEAAWHHPELELGYDTVKVKLTTHSEGAVTEKDMELAEKIDALVKWQPQGGALTKPPEKFALVRG